MNRYQVTTIEDNHTINFLFQGTRDALTTLLSSLEADEKKVSLSSNINDETPMPLLIAPEEQSDWNEHQQVPWLVWNRTDSDDLRDDAYENGALCVLPGLLRVRPLLSALQNATVMVNALDSSRTTALRFKRQLNRGERVHLEGDRVITIQRGIIRCTSLHQDGSEVLIGFYGPGDVLMSHTTHSCHVEMTAHTSLVVSYESWSEASRKPIFYTRLKERICQMELWSSMQARPALEERLMGILGVIAKKFSTRTGEGLVLKIKITHEQLAGAIGATRTTVTRLLGNLRKAGRLSTRRNANGEFFLLTEPDEVHCDH